MTRIAGSKVVHETENAMTSALKKPSRVEVPKTGMSYLKQAFTFKKESPITKFCREVMDGNWVDNQKKQQAIVTRVSNINVNNLAEKLPEMYKTHDELLHVQKLCNVILTTRGNELDEDQKTNIQNLENAVKDKLAELDPIYKNAGREWVKSEFRGVIRNSVKAAIEHRNEYVRKYVGKTSPYATKKEVKTALTSLTSLRQLHLTKEPKPLELEYVAHESIGKRNTMEDFHFNVEVKADNFEGTLTGVLDGHSGKVVADYVGQRIKVIFPEALKQANGDAAKAFEVAFGKIQKEIVEKKVGVNESAGSTAVISYIDKKTNVMTTATLGDCEAHVYRKVDGQLKSFPQSTIRDWASAKDAARAAKYSDDPKKAYNYDSSGWVGHPNPKKLRVAGLNVSRAFGDTYAAGTKTNPGIIQKPKICAIQLQEDDIVVHRCDGLTDFVDETEIVKVIGENQNSMQSIVETLVQSSVEKQDRNVATDNVTVSAIRVRAKS